MNNTMTLKSNFLQVITMGLLALGTILVGLILAQGTTFDFAKLVPGLTVAAALNGLRLARKAYKKGKGLRAALKLVTGWGGVSLVISTLGDAAVGYMLEHQINTLASW